MILSIGVDGGDPLLIRKWSDKLPNFRRFGKEGVSGICRSTIPAISAPAWVSYATGKNPGKTGIVGFIQRREESYENSTVGSFDCREKTLWEIVSGQSRKVVVVNVPLTYPPKKVFGVLVPGFPSPANFQTYPKGLAKKIRKEGYVVDIETGIDPDLDVLKERLEVSIKTRLKIILSLLKKKRPELGVVVFTETDRIQDLFYSQTKHNLFVEKAIFEIYEEIDKAIGELISFNKDGITLINSDHGVCSVERQFNINDWLIKKGYLTVKKEKLRPLAKMFLFFKISVDSDWFRFFYKIGLVPLLRQSLSQSFIRQIPWENYPNFENLKVDWPETKAYTYGNQNLIYINRRGREPEGVVFKEEVKNIVKKIINDLKKEAGSEKISIRIWTKEQIYKGNCINEMPEIIFEMEDNQIIPVTSVGHDQIFSSSGKRKGDHSSKGIFFAIGKGIKKGVKINCRITDLAPTILYSLGFGSFKDMDGRILFKIFSGKKKTTRYFKPGKEFKRSRETKEQQVSKTEEEKMKRRLKELGYI